MAGVAVGIIGVVSGVTPGAIVGTGVMVAVGMMVAVAAGVIIGVGVGVEVTVASSVLEQLLRSGMLPTTRRRTASRREHDFIQSSCLTKIARGWRRHYQRVINGGLFFLNSAYRRVRITVAPNNCRAALRSSRRG